MESRLCITSYGALKASDGLTLDEACSQSSRWLRSVVDHMIADAYDHYTVQHQQNENNPLVIACQNYMDHFTKSVSFVLLLLLLLLLFSVLLLPCLLL